VFAAVNLPILAANPSGWWWPSAFQGRRNATWGSAWFYLFRLADVPVHGAAGAQLANRVAVVVLVGALGWLIVVTMRHQLAPFAAAAAAVAIFVLSNKVYSPTYDLWLVVFFVLLPLSRRLWVTFCAVDLAVFITVYGSFHGLHSAQFVRTVLPVLVAVRTAVLLIIVLRSIRPAGIPTGARPANASRSWRDGRFPRRPRSLGSARGWVRVSRSVIRRPAATWEVPSPASGTRTRWLPPTTAAAPGARVD
jgi:hypothetical protein